MKHRPALQHGAHLERILPCKDFHPFRIRLRRASNHVSTCQRIGSLLKCTARDPDVVVFMKPTSTSSTIVSRTVAAMIVL